MKSIKKNKSAKKTHESSKFEGRINTRLNKKFVIGAVIFAIVCGLWQLVGDANNTDKQKPEDAKAQYVQDFLNSGDDDSNKTQLVEQYGAQYDEKAAKVLNSTPASWDKAMLDDACAALLYADKMGAFTQVNSLLSYMEAAKAQGMDIDDNSYQVNQEIRDAIRQRAEDKAQQQLQGQEQINE